MASIKTTTYYPYAGNPFPSTYYHNVPYVNWNAVHWNLRRQRLMKVQAVREQEYQERYNPILNYNDPRGLNSVADALLNEAAVSNMKATDIKYEIPWFDKNIWKPLVEWTRTADKPGQFDAADVVQRLVAPIQLLRTGVEQPIRHTIKSEDYKGWNKFAGFGHAGINILQNFGETMDTFSNIVKGGVLEKEGPIKGMLRGSGLLGYRQNYDYDTGSFLLDMALETLSDPLTWVSLGSSALAKTSARRTVNNLQKEIAEEFGDAAGRFSKTLVKVMVDNPQMPVREIVERASLSTVSALRKLPSTMVNTLSNEELAEKVANAIVRITSGLDDFAVRSTLLATKAIQTGTDTVNKALMRSVAYTTGVRPITKLAGVGIDTLKNSFAKRAARNVDEIIKTKTGFKDPRRILMYDDTKTVMQAIDHMADASTPNTTLYRRQLYNTRNAELVEALNYEVSKMIRESYNIEAGDDLFDRVTQLVREHTGKSLAEVNEELGKMSSIHRGYRKAAAEFRGNYSIIMSRIEEAKRASDIFNDPKSTRNISRKVLTDMTASPADVPDELVELAAQVKYSDMSHRATVDLENIVKARQDLRNSAYHDIQEAQELRKAFRAPGTMGEPEELVQLHTEIGQRIFAAENVQPHDTLVEMVEEAQVILDDMRQDIQTLPSDLKFTNPEVWSNIEQAFKVNSDRLDVLTHYKDVLVQEHIHNYRLSVMDNTFNTMAKEYPHFMDAYYRASREYAQYVVRRPELEEMSTLIKALYDHDVPELLADMRFGGKTIRVGDTVTVDSSRGSIGTVFAQATHHVEQTAPLYKQIQKTRFNASQAYNTLGFLEKINMDPELLNYRAPINRAVWSAQRKPYYVGSDHKFIVLKEFMSDVSNDVGVLKSSDNNLNALFKGGYNKILDNPTPRLNQLLDQLDDVADPIERNISDARYNLLRRMAVDQTPLVESGKSLAEIRGGQSFYWTISTDSLTAHSGNMTGIAWWTEEQGLQHLKIRPDKIHAPEIEDLRSIYTDLTGYADEDLLAKHLAKFDLEDTLNVDEGLSDLIDSFRTFQMNNPDGKMIGFNSTRFENAYVIDSFLKSSLDDYAALRRVYEDFPKVDIYQDILRKQGFAPLPDYIYSKIENIVLDYLYTVDYIPHRGILKRSNVFTIPDVQFMDDLSKAAYASYDFTDFSPKLRAQAMEKLDRIRWGISNDVDRAAAIAADNKFYNIGFMHDPVTGKFYDVSGTELSMPAMRNISTLTQVDMFHPDAVELRKLMDPLELKYVFAESLEKLDNTQIPLRMYDDLSEFSRTVEQNMRRINKNMNPIGKLHTRKHAEDFYNLMLDYIIDRGTKGLDRVPEWAKLLKSQDISRLSDDRLVVYINHIFNEAIGDAHALNMAKTMNINNHRMSLYLMLADGSIFKKFAPVDPTDTLQFWDHTDIGGLHKAFMYDELLNEWTFAKDSDAIIRSDKAREVLDLRFGDSYAASELQKDMGYMYMSLLQDVQQKGWVKRYTADWTEHGKQLDRAPWRYDMDRYIRLDLDSSDLYGSAKEIERRIEWAANARKNLIGFEEMYATSIADNVSTLSTRELQDYLITASGGRLTFANIRPQNPEMAVHSKTIINRFMERADELAENGIGTYFTHNNERVWLFLENDKKWRTLWDQRLADYKSGAWDNKWLYKVPAYLEDPDTFFSHSHNAKSIHDEMLLKLSNMFENKNLGTMGDMIDYSTLENMEKYIPVEVLKRSIPVDELRAAGYLDTIKFNRTVLGNAASRRELLPKTSSNVYKNYLNSTQSFATIQDSRSKILALWFDADSSIRGDLFNQLTDKELYDALKRTQDTHKLVALIPGKDGRPRMQVINNFDEAMIHTLRNTQEMPVAVMDAMSFGRAYNLLNNFDGVSQTEMSFFRNFIIDPAKKAATLYKVGYLSSPGFLMRNIIDSSFKNLLGGESISDIPRNFKLLFEATRLYKDYNTAIRSIHEALDFKFNIRKAQEIFGQLPIANKMEWRTFKFLHDFFEQGPSAGITGVQQKVIKHMIDAKRAISGESKSLFELVVNNPYSNLILTTNSGIEQVMRLQSMLISVDKGELFNEGVQRLIRTHFDMSLRSKAEYYADYVFPFINFKKENLFYWLDSLWKKGWTANIVNHLTKPVFNLDEYDNDEIYRNRSLQYQILAGNIVYDNNLVFKLNPSIMDTFKLITDPSEFVASMAVYFRIPIELVVDGVKEMKPEEWKHMFYTNVPFIGPMVYRYYDLPQLIDRLLTPYGEAKLREWATPEGAATKAVSRIKGEDFADTASRILAAVSPSIFGAVNRWDDRDFDYFRRVYPRSYTGSKYPPRIFTRQWGSRPYTSSSRARRSRGFRSRRYPRRGRSYSRRVYPRRTYHRRTYARRSYAKKSYAPQRFRHTFWKQPPRTWASKVYTSTTPNIQWKVQMAAKPHNIRMYGSAYKHANYRPNPQFRKVMKPISLRNVYKFMR